MKYYSEKLDKFYETEDECKHDEEIAAEKEHAEEKRKAELADTRKARAKEVEEAYKTILDAQEKYDNLLSEFVKDYGSFHMTISEHNKHRLNPWKDLYDLFFKI